MSMSEEEDDVRLELLHDNFFSNLAKVRGLEDQRFEQRRAEATAHLQADLAAALAERTRLAEALFRARIVVDEKKSALDAVEARFAAEKSEKLAQRDEEDTAIGRWFTCARSKEDGPVNDDVEEQLQLLRQRQQQQQQQRPQQQQPQQPNGQEVEAVEAHLEMRGTAAKANGTVATNGTTNGDHATPDARDNVVEPEQPTIGDDSFGAANDDVGEDASASQDSHDEFVAPIAPAVLTGAEIYDVDGDLIERVKRIDMDNRWIRKALELPIVRRVELRAGMQLTGEHLKSIYKPTQSDSKGTRWLSCMIQAAGQIQHQACTTCTKLQGPYGLCIIVGGEDFPRCGNCEWSRQGCHGAIAAAPPAQPQPQAQPQPWPQPRQQSQDRSRVTSVPAASTRPSPVPTPAPPQEASERPTVFGFTPINPTPPPTAAPSQSAKLLPGGKDKKQQVASAVSTPAEVESVDSPSFDGNGSFSLKGGEDESEAPELDEITKETLTLKHDGMIYLEPEIMRGVPLRKISRDHAYWEAQWKDIEEQIQPKLDEWSAKLVCLTELPKDNSGKHARFLAGRQVNRGKAIINFLHNGEIHPYQIVGKRWISNGLTNYDTLYRLVATLEELVKFNIDVLPLEWLRQRLVEIYAANPDGFRLDKTIHNLYHDEKLVALRFKSGFGNIGRPSGSNKDKSRAGDNGTPGAGAIKADSVPNGGSSGGAGANTGVRKMQQQQGGAKGEKRRDHPTSSARSTPPKKRATSPMSTTPTPVAAAPMGIASGAGVFDTAPAISNAGKEQQTLVLSPRTNYNANAGADAVPRLQAQQIAQPAQVGQPRRTLLMQPHVPPVEPANFYANPAPSISSFRAVNGSVSSSSTAPAISNLLNGRSSTDNGFSLTMPSATTPAAGPTSAAHGETAAPHAAASSSSNGGGTTRLRPRIVPDPDDLMSAGYTSVDSLTQDRVVKRDWRVYQVKTSRLTTNTSTTQYWHWVDSDIDTDGDPMFEHQVLKETEPSTTWGVFKDPIDFHLRLRELVDISYAGDSQKIVVTTREVPEVEYRGNVLAHFKRPRTKKRFLAFMKKKGIKLVKTTSDYIEDEWDKIQSEVMPGDDSE